MQVEGSGDLFGEVREQNEHRDRVACEGTAAADVDRGEVSHERSRAVRRALFAWNSGEERRSS